MSLRYAPIWQDSGTWIALGVSLLFLLKGSMHLVIRRVLRAPAPDAP